MIHNRDLGANNVKKNCGKYVVLAVSGIYNVCELLIELTNYYYK